MKSSHVWALAITAVVGLWLGSSFVDFGTLTLKESARSTKNVDVPAVEGNEKLFRVRVRTYRIEPREISIVVRGRTEASRRVEARARTPGIVTESPWREGDRVGVGEVLCHLDMAEREARLADTRSALASSRRDFDATEQLSREDYASDAKVASDRARVEAAQARVDQVLREIEYTRIRAPMSGIIEERPAEKGSFLQVGSPCANLIELDPIIVSAMVSERDIRFVEKGMEATARLVTGEAVKGRIRYIAAKADIRTRTFKVELEAPNPGKRIRDGVTSELKIPVTTGGAHRLPTSALTLRDNGQVGVSTLSPGNRVRFVPVKILGFERKQVWVGGLPDPVQVITVGQEYVLDGQIVEPVHGTDAKTADVRSQ